MTHASQSQDMSHPSRAELVRVFGQIGILSFGGPAAQIALMHRELVERRPWLTERDYLSALSFCMLLPGPEAMQLATYAGWKMRGVIGGLIAGGLFVLPGAVIMLGLAAAYAYFGQAPLAQALFLGIKATVIVVVLQALARVSKKALRTSDHWVLAGLAFLGIFVVGLPFPLIIGAAAIWGIWAAGRQSAAAGPPPVSGTGTLRTAGIWLGLWLVPLGATVALAPPVLGELAVFFSKLAVVTFGGAYAVLAYMTQEVVQGFGWLTTVEMVDGLGLAETTPGPLILVTEFVGYLAVFREGGPLMAVAAAAITLWMTFVPCFLWIFVGAPYITWISYQPRLSGALDAITAAVVGVILSLSIWFSVHVFFQRVDIVETAAVRIVRPELASVDGSAVVLAVVAAVLLVRFKLPLPLVLAAMSGLGVIAERAL